MNEYVVRAPAKVNLSLDVIGKRPDGYHEMRMVNHSVALSDTLVFEKSGQGISISCSDPKIPTDERNLVHRVAEKLQTRFGIDRGIHIDIKKNIPSEAGLAGGSTDAAAAILGLNLIWALNMSLDEMLAFGSTIGADIPYCCYKGTALVEGIGERIRPVKPLRRLPVLVVKPEISIATPWAFGRLDSAEYVAHPDIDRVIRLVETEDYAALGNAVGNAFEQVVFQDYPEIGEMKAEMLASGAFAAIMSGSGSTVIGYFSDNAAAERAYRAFRQKYLLTFLTEIE
ncbi:4-(cytidine 5'-diphospho)-2-C-methyl-D-erythritol kinase [Eubacterium sp. 1001713B170207_170306_E7]|uniref:4-(cytidine 5'-diphospho)-2-C-methyl-D-erythritol kinase n=1 Tax=Eubacterium sp. 1001713B170207_170306_E7 TaxID=2787097 RepID=UPI001897FCF3|nr:4-(cytidine 5'-diphospho)-2-C-methyl-D-erythritol kinase [Eubacterium sp. 1001713B170207_170306_E7]